MFLHTILRYKYSKGAPSTAFLCQQLCRCLRQKFGKHLNNERNSTIVSQWWGFLECDLLNNILRPFITLMDIGSGGEARVAVPNLLGDQLDVTTRGFVERGCVGMPK